MLIEEAHHDWTYPTASSIHHYAIYKTVYVYEGSYVGVTEKAARMLLNLFKEVADVRYSRLDRVVTVSCCLSREGRDRVEELWRKDE
jgi:hypothetical protein